ncbi:hypothetical protein GCM10017744_001840 [Streptomyces antimycoticus]
MSVTGGTAPGGAAQVYRYGQDDVTAIKHLADQPLTDGGFTTTFPAYSITEYVLPAESSEAKPPTAPGAPAATAVGSDRATLTWGASTAGSSPVASYQVYSGDTAGAPSPRSTPPPRVPPSRDCPRPPPTPSASWPRTPRAAAPRHRRRSR